MLYLKRKIEKGKIKDTISIKGLELRPKNNKDHKDIKKVTITDKKIASKYANKQMDKNLKKVYDKIFKFLTSEDDSENGIKACLGEIEKCKSMLFNKYKEALTNKKYKEYLAKIAITESEFKNKYYEREYYSKIINDMYKNMSLPEIEEIKGKSR